MTHPLCHFCGDTRHPIHAESDAQYGEPVCIPCFNGSYQPDPDSSSQDWEPAAFSPDDMYPTTRTVLVHLNLTLKADDEPSALTAAAAYIKAHGIDAEVTLVEMV